MTFLNISPSRMTGRLTFFLSVTKKLIMGQNSSCPYCGSATTRRIGTIKIVLQLRRCDSCALMFRYPKDDIQESWEFYQQNYNEPTTTDLPKVSDLRRHIASNIQDIAADQSSKISSLGKYRARGKLLDYGSSWVYGVHQLKSAGYDVVGYEVSSPRAEYGRKNLGVTIYESVDGLSDESFDIIFTSHVPEHIPNLKTPFSDFRRLLKPNGFLLIFVPNAGGKIARERGVGWGPMINENHVLAFTAEFFDRNLSRYGLRLSFASGPYAQEPAPLAEKPNLDGEELLVLGQKS